MLRGKFPTPTLRFSSPKESGVFSLILKEHSPASPAAAAGSGSCGTTSDFLQHGWVNTDPGSRGEKRLNEAGLFITSHCSTFSHP